MDGVRPGAQTTRHRARRTPICRPYGLAVAIDGHAVGTAPRSSFDARPIPDDTIGIRAAVHGLNFIDLLRSAPRLTDKVQPVNSGANPYRVIRDWARIEGRTWGGSNGVAIDRDGKTVWATDRCSAGTTPGCAGSMANPVHHFDESGKEIRSFGGGMFVWPHGIHVDRDGNVWVTDARRDAGKGSVVVKFSPDGKVLL